MTDPDRAVAIGELLDQHAIRQVLFRYCRGIDRRDFELVRACYHSDATDDHGRYTGGLDGLIDYLTTTLARFERTMHCLHNNIIELDGDGDGARSETYAVAYHRYAATADAAARDYVVGLRYVDRLTRRGGGWAIQHRVCVMEWSRMDEVTPGYEFPAHFSIGRTDATDPLYSI
jgi:3-phenylpropionate/cinnamic acid dioxygenase small subunit